MSDKSKRLEKMSRADPVKIKKPQSFCNLGFAATREKTLSHLIQTPLSQLKPCLSRLYPGNQFAHSLRTEPFKYTFSGENQPAETWPDHCFLL